MEPTRVLARTGRAAMLKATLSQKYVSAGDSNDRARAAGSLKGFILKALFDRPCPRRSVWKTTSSA